MKAMTTALRRETLEQRIDFIKNQIESLNDYLPETYQLLMNELDAQSKMLMEIRLKQYYNQEEQ